MKLRRVAKLPTFALPFPAHTCHALLPATNSCTPRWFGRRTARVLLADFWYFWSCKSTIRKKLLYDSSLSEFFSLVRKERKGQKEECFPLLNTFCRLAATSANKVPRPSNRSLATATGSKRSSADSDLLLCHVRLRRTSRFRFGCGSACEHSEMGFVSAIYCSNTSSAAVNRATFSRWRRLAKILASVSAHIRPTMPRLGDADTHASHMCQSPYHAGRRRRRPLQDKTPI